MAAREISVRKQTAGFQRKKMNSRFWDG